jgi:cysteinyl-tRNA synthetase
VLALYNSMTRKQERFRPREGRRVILYTCGPSIYQLPHIGNYRTFLFEDILQRYLEYLGYRVDRALFVTDVEDKAIAEANKANLPLKTLTRKNLASFLDELDKLGARKPTYVVKSSDIAEQAATLIEKLLSRGYAYRVGDNIYFDPTTFSGFGRLAGIDMRRWPKKRRRFHRDTYPGNVWNRGDFILWHGAKQGGAHCWTTSLGRGRPSWNVQDPAMALKTSGLRADIYCGGVDNLVRHHDYVIAVAEAYTGETFAHYWLHGEHLVVDGRKMSKSRGNIVYPKDLIDRGCPWQHLRYFLINGHYRKRLNFTFEKFQNACDRLHELKGLVGRIQRTEKSNRTVKPTSEVVRLVDRLRPDFETRMDDNLQVKAAIDGLRATLFKLATAPSLSAALAARAIQELKKIDGVLQVMFIKPT